MESRGNDQTIYEFSDFRLIPGEGLLLQNGEPVVLQPKAFAVLALLVQHHGHLVTKSEFIDTIWEDSFVEENSVSKAVFHARQAIGDSSKLQFIQTVPRRGYRFVAPVKILNSPDDRSNGIERISSGYRLADLNRVQGLGESVGSAETPEVATANVPATRKRLGVYLAIGAIALAVLGSAAVYITSVGTTTVGAGNRIAVLPLKPIDSANRSEILEVGVAELLTDRLNTMNGFVVRPMSATRKYDALDQDPLAAGREQQVDHVVESSYQIADGKFRLTARLINVSSGQVVDSYKVETDAGSVFAIQDAIALEIGNQLIARFGKQSVAVAKRGTTNEEAYRLYLQGRNLTMRRSGGANNKAIEYFEQAIKIDPNYALAYARMAHAKWAVAIADKSTDAEKAKALVKKALELDPNLAEALATRGYIGLAYDWNFAAAENDFQRAIQLEPNNDTAHWLHGLLLTNRGLFDEGLREVEAALTIDPGAVLYMSHRGRILYYARRYDEAITQYQHAIDLDDRFQPTYSWMVRLYETNGDYETAFRYFLKQEERGPRQDQLERYKQVYETSGWLGVREVAETNGRFFDLARLHALRGEKDAAFENLNRAVNERHWLMTTMNVEPAFDDLRRDERFRELQERLAFEKR